MSTESLKRTSKTIETPSQIDNTNNIVELDVLKPSLNTFENSVKAKQVAKRVNIEVLKQRLYE